MADLCCDCSLSGFVDTDWLLLCTAAHALAHGGGLALRGELIIWWSRLGLRGLTDRTGLRGRILTDPFK